MNLNLLCQVPIPAPPCLPSHPGHLPIWDAYRPGPPPCPARGSGEGNTNLQWQEVCLPALPRPPQGCTRHSPPGRPGSKLQAQMRFRKQLWGRAWGLSSPARGPVSILRGLVGLCWPAAIIRPSCRLGIWGAGGESRKVGLPRAQNNGRKSQVPGVAGNRSGALGRSNKGLL